MSGAARSPGARVLAWAPTLLAALAVTHVALVRATQLPLANHDIGWFLHAGAVWLDGGAIGFDVIDTNPPLVVWLSGLEVALARGLGLTPFVTHAGVTSALVLGSALLSCGALLRAPLPGFAVAVFRPLLVESAQRMAAGRARRRRPPGRAARPDCTARAIESRLIRPESVSGRERQREVLDRYAAGEGVLVFSTAVPSVFPVINSSRCCSSTSL